AARRRRLARAAARDPRPRAVAARAAHDVRVRRPLPACGRPLALAGAGAARYSARPPRRVLPSGAGMTAVLQVDELVKHFRVGTGIAGGGSIVYAVDGVLFEL